MMAGRCKKKKKRQKSSRTVPVAAQADDVLHKAMTADCGMLMASNKFSDFVTVLSQLLTLLVILLLSIVLSLMHDDSTAISYILLITLLITILVHELGITYWNAAFAGTFRLIIFWNLWTVAAVLFKLFSELDVFGRVMGVLVSTAATIAAVVALCAPTLARLLSFLPPLLLLFPLSEVGLFGDSILLLSLRIILYILLCMLLDRLYPEAKDSHCKQQRDSLLSISCYWILLSLPQFWVVSVLLIIISWYKSRRSGDEAVPKSKRRRSSRRTRSPSPPAPKAVSSPTPPPATHQGYSSKNEEHEEEEEQEESYSGEDDEDFVYDENQEVDIDLSAYFYTRRV